MRVPWVHLGSYAHILTRTEGELIDSPMRDKCGRRGSSLREWGGGVGGPEKKEHREGTMDAEQAKAAVSTQQDFFSFFFIILTFLYF